MSFQNTNLSFVSSSLRPCDLCNLYLSVMHVSMMQVCMYHHIQVLSKKKKIFAQKGNLLSLVQNSWPLGELWIFYESQPKTSGKSEAR